MKPEKIRRIKKILLYRLNEIQFKLEQTSFEKNNISENPSDDVDKASRDVDQNEDLMMKERNRVYVLELQGAIMRIDRGSFGICEVCKGRISERRLLAVPTTRFCIACLENEENPKAA